MNLWEVVAYETTRARNESPRQLNVSHTTGRFHWKRAETSFTIVFFFFAAKKRVQFNMRIEYTNKIFFSFLYFRRILLYRRNFYFVDIKFKNLKESERGSKKKKISYDRGKNLIFVRKILNVTNKD